MSPSATHAEVEVRGVPLRVARAGQGPPRDLAPRSGGIAPDLRLGIAGAGLRADPARAPRLREGGASRRGPQRRRPGGALPRPDRSARPPGGGAGRSLLRRLGGRRDGDAGADPEARPGQLARLPDRGRAARGHLLPAARSGAGPGLRRSQARPDGRGVVRGRAQPQRARPLRLEPLPLRPGPAGPVAPHPVPDPDRVGLGRRRRATHPCGPVRGRDPRQQRGHHRRRGGTIPRRTSPSAWPRWSANSSCRTREVTP